MNNPYYNNKKLALSCFWVVLGVILLVLTFIDILPSDLYSGIGGGLIAVGILQIIRNLKYKHDPNYKQKIDITAEDERNRFLRMKAWSWTGYIFVLGSALISFAFLIAGRSNLSQIIGLCICAELAIYYISYIVLNKKY